MWDFAGVAVLEFAGEVELAIGAAVILKLRIWSPPVDVLYYSSAEYSRVNVWEMRRQSSEETILHEEKDEKTIEIHMSLFGKLDGDMAEK
ncbi:hypothetical protein DY000_02017201 [Brassica cretica]|uniref:F-box associated domain-containing protein n=1 Tax=Brassica cretica TaxID=69181 RepID=A0ABQ7D548_BRACR|nr:hypothetical protein DY000_02017201 [Brassica cretica]